MGKINGCLKCLFIFFNVVFVLIGCVLIFVAVQATSMTIQLSQFGGPGLGWIWVIAIGVLGLSCLGIYASCAEQNLALKIFAGFMGVGMFIMLIFGIVVVVVRNKAKDGFQSHEGELVKVFMGTNEMRESLKELQKQLHCCGVSGPEDWGSTIPDSCACSPTSQCKARPQGTTGPSSIFSQSCGRVLFSWVDWAFSITMGILFGFAATALMGLLISLLMIHQIKRHDSAGAPSMAMKGY